jgi:CpeT protein
MLRGMTPRPTTLTAILSTVALSAVLGAAARAQTPAPTLAPQRPVSATAAPASTLPPQRSASATAATDSELERLASWMTGSFDTFAQVAADLATGTSYTHLRAVMHIVPADVTGLDAPPGSRLFYVEQAAADAADKPYRQRVYLLARREGVLSNRIYRIANPADLVGAVTHPELLARLTADRLTPEEGCDVIWTRVSDALYTGITGLNGSCKTTWRGADHAVSQVMLTPISITSLDQGFDADGKHVWGPRAGTVGHVFARRGAVPVADLVREFARLRAGDGARDVIWYVEGTVYAIHPDGTMTPTGGIAGFNIARAVARPGGDVQMVSREVFVQTDVERKRILADRPPLVTEVALGIGVRDGKALAGIDFVANGIDMSGAVPPVEILSAATGKVRRYFTAPFVNVEGNGRHYWALESYEFVVPTPGTPGEPSLIWQRDTERPDGTRVHYLASGRAFSSLDDVAASSKLAAELVKLVRETLPASTAAPRP